jgi:hypothetical protein
MATPEERFPMSSTRGIGPGIGQDVGEVGSVREVQPAATVEPAGGGGANDALASLQKILQQIEGAANTKAIPAHQSW